MFKFKIDKEAIDKLCKILKSNELTEIEVKDGNKSIRISKQIMQMSAIKDSPISEEKIYSNNENKNKETKKAIYNLSKDAVKAPMLGTLYHASSPKAPPFIKKGSKVKVGDVIFIIEAMKTMNQVKSDKEGTVKEILVENGLPVEFNQDLVIIN